MTLVRRGVSSSEVISINRVVSDFLKTPVFENLQAYHSRVIFKADLDDDLLNITGSSIHLGKTVMNLMSNAAEAILGAGDGESVY